MLQPSGFIPPKMDVGLWSTRETADVCPHRPRFSLTQRAVQARQRFGRSRPCPPPNENPKPFFWGPNQAVVIGEFL